MSTGGLASKWQIFPRELALKVYDLFMVYVIHIRTSLCDVILLVVPRATASVPTDRTREKVYRSGRWEKNGRVSTILLNVSHIICPHMNEMNNMSKLRWISIQIGFRRCFSMEHFEISRLLTHSSFFNTYLAVSIFRMYLPTRNPLFENVKCVFQDISKWKRTIRSCGAVFRFVISNNFVHLKYILLNVIAGM